MIGFKKEYFHKIESMLDDIEDYVDLNDYKDFKQQFTILRELHRDNIGINMRYDSMDTLEKDKFHDKLLDDFNKIKKLLTFIETEENRKMGKNEMSLFEIFKHIVKEDVSYTPEKAKSLYEKYQKDLSNYQSQAERLYNIVQNFSLGDLLENGGEDKIDKLGDTVDKIKDKVSEVDDDLMNISDNMEDTDSNLSNLSNNLHKKYHQLYMHLTAMFFFLHNIYMASADMKEEDLANLTKYKK